MKCLTTDCKNESRYQSGLCGVCDALANKPTEKGENDLREFTIKSFVRMFPSRKGFTLDDVKRWGRINSVLDEVRSERERQHAKWGEQNWPDGTGPDKYFEMDSCTSIVFWEKLVRNAREDCEACFYYGDLTFRQILWEEVCEAFAESDPAKLRAELIQVCALSCQWCEAIDRRGAK